MSHIVLVLPELLDPTCDESLVGTMPVGWQANSHSLRLFPSEGNVLLQSLGLNPGRFPISPGAITIAALGLEPPPLSVLFRLSLLSYSADRVAPGLVATQEEIRAIRAAASRLGGGKWTICTGDCTPFGLVWENGSLDLQCHSPSDAAGSELRQVWPSGEGERVLRQLIEDSVECLSELDCNRRRVDEGQPPLNLLWPWGPGLRTALPNLPFEFGKPVLLVSDDEDAAGIARLSRCRFQSLGNPFRSEWSPHPFPGVQVHVSNVFKSSRQANRLERAEEVWRRILDRMIIPAMDSASMENPVKIEVVSPSERGPGLHAIWRSLSKESDGVPLHERAIHDERLVQKHLWESVHESLLSPAFWH